MNHIRSAVLGMALSVGVSAPLVAQAPQRPTAPQPAAPAVVPVFQESQDARETLQRFQELLRQFPPAVGEVLQRDPSLLGRADYLAPYPALVAFLQQHPEIARNPSFFLGSFEYNEPRARDRAFDTIRMIFDRASGMAIGALVAGVFIWLVRSLIDHRRWLRLSKVQAEVHTKLLDRLTATEDLLAYIQSPAGRHFLESAPIALQQEPRVSNAPVSRIILSLQAGVVLIALGTGFWFVQGKVVPEVGEGFFIIGVLAVALGTGFAASSLAAYLVSARLGLVNPPTKTEQA